MTRAVSSSATADVRENRTELGNEPLGLKPLPKHLVAENLADDPTLGNPLQRHKRMGTDWIGVIMDYEGGLVEDTTRLHTEAWLRLAEEEVKPRPVTHVLKRAALMKAEQVTLGPSLALLLVRSLFLCRLPDLHELTDTI